MPERSEQQAHEEQEIIEEHNSCDVSEGCDSCDVSVGCDSGDVSVECDSSEGGEPCGSVEKPYNVCQYHSLESLCLNITLTETSSLETTLR